MDEQQRMQGTPDGAPLIQDTTMENASEEFETSGGYTYTGESEPASVKDQFEKVYNGLTGLSDDIRREVDVFANVEDMIRRGSGDISLKRRTVLKTLDEAWIKVIEDSIIPLDNVIRKPRRFIEENEAILPIELSRNITSRSIRHLSQHTDYISKIEGDTITPSKILNVFRDETVQTYENRFVNTLINRLYSFVMRRYNQIKENGRASATSVLNYSTGFETAFVKGKINLNIEVTSASEADVKRASAEELELWRRLEHVRSVVATYAGSPFVKMMGTNYVRPPIMHTNAINKNKDLRQCVALWEFIESYEGVGYDIDIRDSAEKMDDRHLDEMLSTLSMQYCVFRYNMDADLTEDMILAHNETEEPFVPKFLDSLEAYESDDFNVYDTSYQKYMSVNRLNPRRKLTDGEWRIRRAIDVALKADRIRDLKRLADENERKKRLEEEELAARMESEEQSRLEREAEEAAQRANRERESIAIEEMQAKSANEDDLRLEAEQTAEQFVKEQDREAEVEAKEEEIYAENMEAERLLLEEAEKKRLADEETAAINDILNPEVPEEENERRRLEELEQQRAEEERDRMDSEESVDRLALEEADEKENEEAAKKLSEEKLDVELDEEARAISEQEEEAARLALEEEERSKAEELEREEAEREETARLALEEEERAKEEILASEKEAERFALEEAEKEEAERILSEQENQAEAERLAREKEEREELELLARQAAELEEAERLIQENAESENSDGESSPQTEEKNETESEEEDISNEEDHSETETRVKQHQKANLAKMKRKRKKSYKKTIEREGQKSDEGER